MDGLILLSILLLQEVADQSSEGTLRIEASVAFAGLVSSSSLTELKVRAFSRHGGDLTLATVGGSPNVSLEMQLPAGVATEIRVPLGVDFSGPPPTVHARTGNLDSTSVALNTVRHGGAQSVLVGTLATQLLLRLPQTESVGGATLPHFAPAYRQIAALAIDGSALAALDEAQLRALLQFAGTCGRLLLIDVSSPIEQVFSNRAACDGRYLGSVQSADNVEAAFAAILEPPTTTLATDRQLGRLLAESTDSAVDLTRLIQFWIGYLLVFTVLNLRSRTRFAALGFGGVGTLLVFLIWPATPSRGFVAWAEATANDRVAHYTGIERYVAPRRGILTLPTESFGAQPASIRGADYFVHWNTDGEQPNLVWNASSFGQLDKLTYGSFAVDSRLRAQPGAESVSVCNHGTRVSGQVFLQWQGTVYSIPPMQPGTVWASTDQLAMGVDALRKPELQLFLNRSAGYTTTILQVLPVSGGGGNDRAWLLRYESDSAGDAPCRK